MKQLNLPPDSSSEARRKVYSLALSELPQCRTQIAFHELAAHLMSAACGPEPQCCNGPVFYARYFLDKFLHVRIERDQWGNLRARIATR